MKNNVLKRLEGHSLSVTLQGGQFDNTYNSGWEQGRKCVTAVSLGEGRMQECW